ncbi:MAG: hypothetical protein AAFQ90_11500 [Pseudomonadota bacterium]
MRFVLLTVIAVMAASVQALEPEDAPSEPRMYPLKQVSCDAVQNQEDDLFSASKALIIVPVPYTITNERRRLKFYNGLLAFGDVRDGYTIGQPKIFQADMDDRNGRFGNLKARQSNADIPTTFSFKDQLYEIQATSGFPMKKRIDAKSFSIDASASFEIKIEAVTESIDRADPVWIGTCKMKSVTNGVSL